ncbi:hypothetical protein MAPG_07449 [Magnaporthiopsis poae ATCC 64411]|uniref:Uncharacterized protein n=1 Tax=Magnaporthiopsis poae (strain ATCC 64411 / 73-15) TaxID=644358 RepID=A0A0C4E4Q0_MAGP6|nr:hypothetical protein MAPG_07449 [Magnaporthiopsis poae ATCC 64411]
MVPCSSKASDRSPARLSYLWSSGKKEEQSRAVRSFPLQVCVCSTLFLQPLDLVPRWALAPKRAPAYIRYKPPAPYLTVPSSQLFPCCVLPCPTLCVCACVCVWLVQKVLGIVNPPSSSKISLPLVPMVRFLSDPRSQHFSGLPTCPTLCTPSLRAKYDAALLAFVRSLRTCLSTTHTPTHPSILLCFLSLPAHDPVPQVTILSACFLSVDSTCAFLLSSRRISSLISLPDLHQVSPRHSIRFGGRFLTSSTAPAASTYRRMHSGLAPYIGTQCPLTPGPCTSNRGLAMSNNLARLEVWPEPPCSPSPWLDTE